MIQICFTMQRVEHSRFVLMNLLRDQSLIQSRLITIQQHHTNFCLDIIHVIWLQVSSFSINLNFFFKSLRFYDIIYDHHHSQRRISQSILLSFLVTVSKKKNNSLFEFGLVPNFNVFCFLCFLSLSLSLSHRARMIHYESN